MCYFLFIFYWNFIFIGILVFFLEINFFFVGILFFVLFFIYFSIMGCVVFGVSLCVYFLFCFEFGGFICLGMQTNWILHTPSGWCVESENTTLFLIVFCVFFWIFLRFRTKKKSLNDKSAKQIHEKRKNKQICFVKINLWNKIAMKAMMRLLLALFLFGFFKHNKTKNSDFIEILCFLVIILLFVCKTQINDR